MAIITLPQILRLPPGPVDAAAGGSTLTLNTSGYKAAFLFVAPATGNIDRVAIVTSTVTTPTDTDVRLETIDPATGMPTGTLWAANTNATVASGSIKSNTSIEVTLTAAAAVTKGDIIALVIAPTGTPNYIIRQTVGLSNYWRQFPYRLSYTTAWIKFQTDGWGAFGIRYDTGAWPSMGAQTVLPATIASAISVNTTTSPDELGNLFQFSQGLRVAGFWLDVDLDGDADVVLYDSDGSTPLLTKSLDKDVRGTTFGDPIVQEFDTTADLAANTSYRLAIKPTTITTCRMYVVTLGAAAMVQNLANTATYQRTERTDAGAWTETATQMVSMGLLIDGIEDGGSGGIGGAGKIRGGLVG